MNKYKLSVTKGQKKYSIIIQATSEEEAREKVHKEGYSILAIEITNDAEVSGTKFIFTVIDVSTNSQKQGTIISDDIFKAYLKLKDELNYNPIALYGESDRESSAEEKQKIISSLQEQYKVYTQTIKEKGIQQAVKQQENLKESTLQVNEFYQKKELEETYKLIDFVLKKIEGVVEKSEIYEIGIDQKEKLKEIYNSIIKIKKSTNTSKLKQIAELALLKIGEIELKYLEKTKSSATKDLLQDTNKLLKQVGSTKQFVEKSKDLNLIFANIMTVFGGIFQKNKKQKSNFESIDKQSYSYLKTILLLNKYRAKQSQNNKEILQSFYLFLFPFGSNREKIDTLLLKGRVISQNISLLRAKKSGHIFSYTFVTRGYSKIVDFIIGSLYATRNYIFFAIISYACVFLTAINLAYYKIIDIQLNFNGVFYALMILFTLCLVNISRGLVTLSLNVVFLFFLFIFGVVNF